MNLKEIIENVLVESKKLGKGTEQEKEFGSQLAAVAKRIEAHRIAHERPFESGDLKLAIGETPNVPRRIFTLRHLKPEDQRMYRG